MIRECKEKYKILLGLGRSKYVCKRKEGALKKGEIDNVREEVEKKKVRMSKGRHTGSC